MPGIKIFGLNREEVGVVGSYFSFFGLLLIATVLSYKSIFYFIIENFMIHVHNDVIGNLLNTAGGL